MDNIFIGKYKEMYEKLSSALKCEKKPNYCEKPEIKNCKVCYLSNYGRDCQNNEIRSEKNEK